MSPANSGYCHCGQANSVTLPGEVVFSTTFAAGEISATARLVAFGSAKCTNAPNPARVEVQIRQGGAPWLSIGFLTEVGAGRVALAPVRSALPLIANVACEVRFVLAADTETADDKDFFGVTVLELDE